MHMISPVAVAHYENGNSYLLLDEVRQVYSGAGFSLVNESFFLI